MGRSISNDIVILDQNVPLHFMQIQRHGAGYQMSVNRRYHKQLAGGDCVIRYLCYQFVVRKSWRLGLAWLQVLLLCLCVAVWAVTLGQSDGPVIDDQPVALTVPMRQAFGNIDDQSNAKNVWNLNFLQPVLDGSGCIRNDPDCKQRRQTVLHFTAGNVENGQWLELLVNNHRVGWASVCLGCWSTEQRISIPFESLRTGVNELTFRWLGPPNQSWGVRQVYITHRHSDGSEAYALKAKIESLKLLFEERSVSPVNLALAHRLLADIVSNASAESLHALDGFASQIELAMQQYFDETQNEAFQMVAVGDFDSATNRYKQALLVFPDHSTPHRSRIEAALSELNLQGR